MDQRPVRTKSPMQASHHHHLHSHAHEHARAVERSLHAFALAHVCECAHVQVWAGRILRAHLVCLGMRICAHKPSCTHWRAVLHLCMYMSVRMHIPMSGCARARGQLGSSIHTVGIIRALTQTDTCAQHTWTRLLLTRHLIVHNAECICTVSADPATDAASNLRPVVDQQLDRKGEMQMRDADNLHDRTPTHTIVTPHLAHASARPRARFALITHLACVHICASVHLAA